MKFPKFHDRLSLIIWMLSGLMLMMIGFAVGTSRITDNEWLFGLFITVFGGVLAFHCLDMFRYYKGHWIVKIVKSDTERIVYK